MDLHITHDILIAGPDLDTCRRLVLRFFSKNLLVRYDAVEVVADHTLRGDQPGFWERVEQGEAANRKALAGMLVELKQEGLRQVDDIQRLEQGYRSKLFHTIAHLLDGFFGIDTFLYNLEEDSHWVSAALRQQIIAQPAGYWLARVAAHSKGNPDRLPSLRSMQT